MSDTVTVLAGELTTGDSIVNVGTVLSASDVGVFKVLRVAQDQWSLATGRLSTVDVDVVRHCTSTVVIYGTEQEQL